MLALSFIDRIVDNIYKSVKKNGYMSIKKWSIIFTLIYDISITNI